MVGNISVWQLLILLLIVLLLFGTKRLRNIGSDLGGAIKSFRKSMDDSDDDARLEADPVEKSTVDETSAERNRSSS